MPIARFLLPWLLALLLAPAAAAESPGALLTQAEWSVDGQAWQPVALPDDWGRRGIARPSDGFYRLQFEHPGPVAGDWRLWSARLPLHHRLWLNGEPVSDLLEVPDAKSPRTTAMGVMLPGRALREGRNELRLQERGGPRAGLGPLWVGAPGFAEEPARWHQRLYVDLPRFVNGLAAGAGMFALLLWLRRRSEVALGWFGLVVLIFSLRNVIVVEPGSPTPPGFGVGTYLLIVAVNAVFGLFAASVSGLAPRHYARWVVAGLGLAMAVPLLVGSDAQTMDGVRTVVYALLSLHALYATVLLWRAARRLSRRLWWAVVAPALALMVATVFDQALYAGRLPQHWEFLLPWVTPLIALGYGGLLAGRLVHALAERERAGQVLEQRVRERTTELEAANAAKTRFLAAASHDLRQPMVTIGVLIGVLREQPMSPGQRRVIDRVDEAAAAMEGLLAGLLDLSRLEAGGLRVRHEVVPLAPLLRAVESHAHEAALSRGLTLRLRVPPRAAVQGDPVLIEQIVRNLVANALRYTLQGGVLVGVQRRGCSWRIAVWDTGPGIAPEQQQRVFEDFVQLDNPERERSRGLGLGLAIVRRAAALLGAPVQLRSLPGRGSCFSLTLTAAEPVALAPQVALAAPAPALQQRTVVLVEDDAGAREALRMRLAAWGAEVRAYASPAALDAALAAGTLAAPALLVTDMRLPGGSGLDVVQRLRERWPGLPAVVVTGNTAPEDLSVLSDSGLPVVHKPFRAEALAAALWEALGPVHTTGWLT